MRCVVLSAIVESRASSTTHQKASSNGRQRGRPGRAARRGRGVRGPRARTGDQRRGAGATGAGGVPGACSEAAAARGAPLRCSAPALVAARPAPPRGTARAHARRTLALPMAGSSAPRRRGAGNEEPLPAGAATGHCPPGPSAARSTYATAATRSQQARLFDAPGRVAAACSSTAGCFVCCRSASGSSCESLSIDPLHLRCFEPGVIRYNSSDAMAQSNY